VKQATNYSFECLPQNDDALGERAQQKLKSLMNAQLAIYIHVGFCKKIAFKGRQ
jgi:coproporphyrinogen III oxidase-like Fe-S oxidoreductase